MRIAPPSAPISGYMFGKGAYFADMSSKSANYCRPSAAAPFGILVLAEVALGEQPPLQLVSSSYTAGEEARAVPGRHSVYARGRWSPQEAAEGFAPAPPVGGYRAMADEEPSPALIPVGKPIKHPAEVAPALEHNEFIVYDAARVKLRYVLQVRFDGGCGAFL